MIVEQLSRASRGADRAICAVVSPEPSPRRQRAMLVGVVLFVAAHYRRPRQRDVELVA